MASGCSFDHLVREIDDNLQIISRSQKSCSSICLLGDPEENAYGSPTRLSVSPFPRSCQSEPARSHLHNRILAVAASRDASSANNVQLPRALENTQCPKGRPSRVRQRLDFNSPRDMSFPSRPESIRQVKLNTDKGLKNIRIYVVDL